MTTVWDKILTDDEFVELWREGCHDKNLASRYKYLKDLGLNKGLIKESGADFDGATISFQGLDDE